jgi:DNA mismatch repair protein MutL
MENKIIKLDERISNMIAAGEVVSRPANALKEMIENAIDADATKIDIDLLGNGLKEIKVIDNGYGMSEADLKTAFFRHATSKIRTEFDLAHIDSLGFRGEAIPAIASVSKMTIKSRPKNSDGYLVSYEGGKLKDSESAALNEGTEVIINDLFYNVPARLKFVKSPQTELSHLTEVVDEFILAYPYISFRLRHENKVLRQSFGTGDYEELFELVFGKGSSKNMISFEKNVHNIKIEAQLGSPDITRARRNNIYIFLNGRAINNFILTNAVIEGYHTRLMVNRYPIGIVKITVDPAFVDVNVHPQKREVKLSNEYVIASLIRTSIREQFQIVKKRIVDSLANITQMSSFDYEINELDLDYEEVKKDIYVENMQKLPQFDYIGQLAGTYLLFQNEDGLYLIDQHAAAERVRYEHYYEKLGEKSPVKGLLIPLSFEFRPTQMEIIVDNLVAIKKLGLTLVRKDNTYELTEMPYWLADDDVYLFIENIVESLEKYKEVNLKYLRDNLSKSIACKGAIKANKPLSNDEVNHLVSVLRETKNPYYCPHGRPVLLFFSYYEIEKMFKRIV